MKNEFKNLILLSAPKFEVKDKAPNTELELFNEASLVIWSGASENTIWQDPKVNYAFRAMHDQTHLETGLGFSPAEEIELARIQASKYSGLFADLIYTEVAEQARHYLQTGQFVQDQVAFTMNQLKKRGYNVAS